MKRTPILATLVLTIAPSLPALAQSDPTAGRSHFLPHIADGGGWQSTLIVTNVSDAAGMCTLEVNGGLTLDRFQDPGDDVTVTGSTATFDLSATGGYLVWSTRNVSATVNSYAILDCEADVTAQITFAFFSGSDRPEGIATVFSSTPGREFQVPVLNATGTVGFAIANDSDADANCNIVLEDPQRNEVARLIEMEMVESKTNKAVLLNDEKTTEIPGTFEMGSATVSCDQQVAVIGLHFELGGETGILTFNTLPPAVLSAGEATGPADMYTPLEGLTVAHGQVSLGDFALTFCLDVLAPGLSPPGSGVTYTVHTSKWQRRDDANAPWTDVEGQTYEGRVCPYSPTEPGQYRLVGDLTVRRMNSSENWFTVE